MRVYARSRAVGLALALVATTALIGLRLAAAPTSTGYRHAMDAAPGGDLYEADPGWGLVLTTVTGHSQVRGVLPAAQPLALAADGSRLVMGTDRGPMAFQDYFVRERAVPRVDAVAYAGIEGARPSAEVVQAVGSAGLVVIGPSNPVVSVWPILTLLGAALPRERTLAVTPVVEGAALKGPTVEMMRSLGRDPSATGVAREYRELASGFVLDARDRGEAAAIEALGYRVLVTDTVMTDAAAAARLAEALLSLR